MPCRPCLIMFRSSRGSRLKNDVGIVRLQNLNAVRSSLDYHTGDLV